MTQSATGKDKDIIHILHLSYDNDDCAALTILANDVRFHVTANPKDLQNSRNKGHYYDYLDRYGLRDAEQKEYDAAHERPDHTKAEESDYSDSAACMTVDAYGEDEDPDSLSANFDLRKWLLMGMTGVIAEYAPPNLSVELSSLYDWYHGPTYFYSLAIKGGKLVPEPLKECDEMSKRIEQLPPRMKMPQYIQKIDVPWINAKDLVMQSEVDFPEPAHPGKVT